MADQPDSSAPEPASADLPGTPQPVPAFAEPLIRQMLLGYIKPALGPIAPAFKAVT